MGVFQPIPHLAYSQAFSISLPNSLHTTILTPSVISFTSAQHCPRQHTEDRLLPKIFISHLSQEKKKVSQEVQKCLGQRPRTLVVVECDSQQQQAHVVVVQWVCIIQCLYSAFKSFDLHHTRFLTGKQYLQISVKITQDPIFRSSKQCWLAQRYY